MDKMKDELMATRSIRLEQGLIEKATIRAKALNRTPARQIEHWAKIGEMMEDNPDLPYEFVKQAIIAKAEMDEMKVERYEKALLAAEQLLESRQRAEFWLQRHARALDAKPIDLLDTDEGLDAVLMVIGRLEHCIVT